MEDNQEEEHQGEEHIDIINMKLKHPFIEGIRKIISDDRLSFNFSRRDISLDIDGCLMFEDHIYLRRPDRLYSTPSDNEYWDDMYPMNPMTLDELRNKPLTIWIHEGYSGYKHSYTKIKGYQTKHTCFCFRTFKIDEMSYHYIDR